MRKILTTLKASDEFTDATQGGSAHSIECDYCGRINVGMYVNEEHECSYADIEEDKEYLRQVQLRNETCPDDYVLHYDRYWVRYTKIDHSLLPDDCICNSLRWYEDFIKNNMHTIDQYKVMLKLKSE